MYEVLQLRRLLWHHLCRDTTCLWPKLLYHLVPFIAPILLSYIHLKCWSTIELQHSKILICFVVFKMQMCRVRLQQQLPQSSHFYFFYFPSEFYWFLPMRKFNLLFNESTHLEWCLPCAWKTKFWKSSCFPVYWNSETLFCQAEPDVSLGLECIIPNLAINQPGVTHRNATESVGWYLTAGLPLGLGWDLSHVLFLIQWICGKHLNMWNFKSHKAQACLLWNRGAVCGQAQGELCCELCEQPYMEENCLCWTGSLQNDKYGVVFTLHL